MVLRMCKILTTDLKDTDYGKPEKRAEIGTVTVNKWIVINGLNYCHHH